ncbi:MAG: ankyrin repeat domain-containing protein [bacterium]
MTATLDALVDAIKNRDAARLAALLGEDPGLVEAVTAEGMSPLVIAIYWRNPAAQEALLAAGAPYPAPLAAARGDAARLAALAGADPRSLAEWSADGWSPLHLAAHFGHAPACLWLLRHGADVRVRSRNGLANLPCHAAAAGNHTAVVGLLLAAGTPPNEPQHGGWTLLHQAAQHANRDMVELLLAAGADPGQTNDEAKRAADLVPSGQDVLRALLE